MFDQRKREMADATTMPPAWDELGPDRFDEIIAEITARRVELANGQFASVWGGQPSGPVDRIRNGLVAKGNPDEINRVPLGQSVSRNSTELSNHILEIPGRQEEPHVKTLAWNNVGGNFKGTDKVERYTLVPTERCKGAKQLSSAFSRHLEPQTRSPPTRVPPKRQVA